LLSSVKHNPGKVCRYISAAMQISKGFQQQWLASNILDSLLIQFSLSVAPQLHLSCNFTIWMPDDHHNTK